MREKVREKVRENQCESRKSNRIRQMRGTLDQQNRSSIRSSIKEIGYFRIAKARENRERERERVRENRERESVRE